MSFDAVNDFSSKQNYADLASLLSLFFTLTSWKGHTLWLIAKARRPWKAGEVYVCSRLLPYPRDTVQDFLCKVDMKPLTDTSASSGNNQYFTISVHWHIPTKIITNLLKDCKILNLGMARCREMVTLPVGYILQHKVPSSSSSESLFHFVCAVL